MSSTRMPFSGPGSGRGLSLSRAGVFMIWSWVSGRTEKLRGRDRPGGAGPGGPGYLAEPSSLFAVMTYWLGVGGGQVDRAGDVVGRLAGRHRGAQVPIERGEEVLRGQERDVLAGEQGQVLGHLAGLDCGHADVLQGVGEPGDARGAVQLAAV